jgi:hypothetical protein
MPDDEKSRRQETDAFQKWITEQKDEAPALTEDLADLFPDEFEFDDDEDENESSDDKDEKE